MRATKQQIDELAWRDGVTVGPPAKLNAVPRARGRTVRHEVGRMNGLEKAYAAKLGTLAAAGVVYGYWFEGVKLRLADKTWYSPDFLVLLTDGSVEIHEVKGFVEDDARAKWKIAAETYPLFAFVWATRRKGEWKEERYRGPA